MAYLADSQADKIRILLRTKLWAVGLAFAIICLINIAGIRNFKGLLPGYIAVVCVAIFGLIMKYVTREGNIPVWLAHFSFFSDISAIILGIYFHGSLETPWVFTSVVVTFMVAYVLGTAWGVAYAFLIPSLFAGVFSLEFYSIIPHVEIYDISGLYYIDPGYFIDNIVGIFLLHVLMAFSVGSLSKLTDQRSEKISDYAVELKQSVDRQEKIEQEVESVARELKERKNEVLRRNKIREDREKEIEETEKEIERIKREKSL